MTFSFRLLQVDLLPKRFYILFLLVCFGMICGEQTHARAQSDTSSNSATIDAVSVGIKDVYKVGKWTPISTTVTTTAGGEYHLEFETVDADGAPFRIAMKSVAIEAAGTQTLTGRFLPGRIEADLKVLIYQKTGETQELISERIFPSRRFTENSLPVAEKQSLHVIGVLDAKLSNANIVDWKTASPEQLRDWPLNFISSQNQIKETLKPNRVLMLNAYEELPIDVESWQGLDALIVTGNYNVPPEQEKALQKWVQSGGHLLVMVGDRLEEWQASSLSKWLPVSINGTINLKHLGDIENYVSQGRRLVRTLLDTVRIEPDSFHGKVEVASIEGPLVVKIPHGFGELTISAIDFSEEPLSEWESLPPLLEKLLGRETTATGSEESQVGKNLVHAGVSSLRTQLQGTLDQFKATRNLNAWEVMIRILGIIILLGPLDYLLTHKVLKRPGLTWVTFPLMLVGLILVTFSMSGSMHHDQSLLQEVNLVDLDAESGLCRFESWQSYYSAESEQINIEVHPIFNLGLSAEDTITFPQTRWSGTPEENFSGMYRSSGIYFGLPTYLMQVDKKGLEQVPIGQWSSKVIETAWLSQLKDKSLVESNLTTGTGGNLEGTFKHQFPVPLKQWFVAYQNQVYLPELGQRELKVASLAAGEVWDIGHHDVMNRTMKNYLTNRVGDQNRTGQDVLGVSFDKYNVEETDPYRIMRSVTFYEASGGQDYYTLSNEVFADYDFSARLDMKQAVLYGTIDLPVISTEVNGTQIEPVYQKTIIRILLPVK
ncbi:MAG: hypothetical protein R3C11_21480 [Planctomycetaceae bacterium]